MTNFDGTLVLSTVSLEDRSSVGIIEAERGPSRRCFSPPLRLVLACDTRRFEPQAIYLAPNRPHQNTGLGLVTHG